ncbi:MAG: GntR family transcriptional regulator [Armatimonadetes bacterium]|nr:GntR family transcriptional regulator [Candidatus Hippobium faecium]
MTSLEEKILNIKSELDYESGATPLYAQIANLIKLIIRYGVHEGGEKLPSERVMAEYFEVSRVTVRKTLEELMNENCVCKIRGKGVFVSETYKPKLPKLHVGFLFIKDCVFEYHPMNIRYFEGIDSVLKKYDYSSEIITTESCVDPESFRDMIAGKKINAVISFIAEKNINQKVGEVLSDMPLVSRMSENKTGFVDYEKVIREMFEYVYSQGHRHIAYNFAIPGMESTDIMLSEYRRLCNKYSLVPYEFECENYTMEEGRRIIGEIKKQKEITAVLAADDFVSQGMLRGLYDMNMSCPEDMSIVGIGDYDFADYLVPPLTTVKIPYYEIGVRLARALINKTVYEDAKTQFVERDSVQKLLL